MFPFGIVYELISVPELFKQGATLVRVTMTEENFLAGLRIRRQNYIRHIATAL